MNPVGHLFFAGHGTTLPVGNRIVSGYLIPQDARAGRYADSIDCEGKDQRDDLTVRSEQTGQFYFCII